ncbi:NAD(P)-dependent oxidoreductase [Mycobacterium sp. 236(2023)]|uniref:NAD-dependent epimerase/dehydratase family protein n=1 Tax=Mycobacterium sp. 236(2023) TaxID=3038163 RepID=UPI0024150377|nr:NAD(P)-dependent oxidoreductase [Mycobacterium sp. 236(2023)]MDG4665379.1 NAD(P)-dependent oxidoreductase [Mycobacterium sp. 236(2023)]
MSKPIAIIGAGGWVGARLVERAELLGDVGGVRIVPIVRSRRSQGRLARFGTCTVLGDAGDPASLVPLLKGCGMVVNLTLGNDERIVGDVESIYSACVQAEVPLFVHMSSAEVFGRADAPNLSDDSVADSPHWMEYAHGKRAAEAWLRSQTDGPVKVIMLRPGLIWGPGSVWLVDPAKALVSGTAYLFGEGQGICNLIHVDNLISYLVHLAKAPETRSGIFNISDNETTRWADFYHAIAREVGVDPATIRLLPDSAFQESRLEPVRKKLFNVAPARAVKRRMSGDTKGRIKQELRDRFRPSISEVQPIAPEPAVTKQLWWLQGTAQKLPSTKFAEHYPGLQLAPFADLMAASGHWLRYAGFQNPDARS